MSGVLPESDPVIVREHFYQDTQVASLVVSDFPFFVPVEKKGLGLFNYGFSNTERIGTTHDLDYNKEAFWNVMGIAFVCTALLTLLIKVATSKMFRSEAVADLENVVFFEFDSRFVEEVKTAPMIENPYDRSRAVSVSSAQDSVFSKHSVATEATEVLPESKKFT